MLRITFLGKNGYVLPPTTKIIPIKIRGGFLLFSICYLNQDVGTLAVSLEDLLNCEKSYIDLRNAWVSHLLGPRALFDLARMVKKGKTVIDFIKTPCYMCGGKGVILSQGDAKVCSHCFGKGQEWILSPDAGKCLTPEIMEVIG